MPVRRSLSLRSIAIATLSAVFTLAGSACLHPTGCDADLRISYSPVDTTLRIGQSFRPNVRLTTCGGTEQVTEALRYAADDTTIVRVDSLSGTMTARGVGHTNASVTSANNGTVARIGITVQ